MINKNKSINSNTGFKNPLRLKYKGTDLVLFVVQSKNIAKITSSKMVLYTFVL